MMEHKLNERSNVSYKDKLVRDAKIIVYAENYENEQKNPHFHVYVDNKDIKVSMMNITSLCIINNMTWDGYEDVKSSILEWLSKPMKIIKTKEPILNYECLHIAWCAENPNNEFPIEDMKFLS